MTTAPCPYLCGGGGATEGGRHIVYKNEPPLSNVLFRAMLDKVGVQADKLGESTGVAEI